jgi:hypothetical protein
MGAPAKVPIDAEALARARIGDKLRTLTEREINRIHDVRDGEIVVETKKGIEPVPIAEVQEAADDLVTRGEIRVSPKTLGYRSSFIGALLATHEDVEVFLKPQRLRLTRRR